MGNNLSDDDVKAWLARVYSRPNEEIVDMIFSAREREKDQHSILCEEMLKVLGLELRQFEANKKRPKDVAMKEAHQYWQDCREGRVQGLKPDDSNFTEKFVATVQTQKWPILSSRNHLLTKMKAWEKEFLSPPVIPKIERPIAGPLDDDVERTRLLALDKHQLLKVLSNTLAATGRHLQNTKPYKEKNDSARRARSSGGTGRAAHWKLARGRVKQLLDERKSGKRPDLYPDSKLIDEVRKDYPDVGYPTIKDWLAKLRKVQ